MFDTLLESRPHAERSAGGAIASVTAHSAIIAAAIFATAQARLPSLERPETMQRVYFPPRPVAAPVTAAATTRKNVGSLLPAPIDPRRIDVNLPPINVLNPPSAPIDFVPKPIVNVLTPGGSDGSESNAPFQADQVEKQVSFVAGSASPRYPDALRSSGVEGKVVAQFVVDERGRAETDSVRFLSSDNQLFEAAVKAALPRMRFTPAEIGGRKVRQLVQMPFVFTIDR